MSRERAIILCINGQEMIRFCHGGWIERWAPKFRDHPRKAATMSKRVNLAWRAADRLAPPAWGVLDAMPDAGRVEVAAISATSAGTMNAVALADGFTASGAGSCA